MSVIPHLGHTPGASRTTSACMGHTNVVPGGVDAAAIGADEGVGP